MGYAEDRCLHTHCLFSQEYTLGYKTVALSYQIQRQVLCYFVISGHLERVSVLQKTSFLKMALENQYEFFPMELWAKLRDEREP